MRYLNLCPDIVESNNEYFCTVSLQHIKFNVCNRWILINEIINQFAVKVYRKYLGCKPSDIVLPTRIIDLLYDRDICFQYFLIRANITPKGKSYFVSLTVENDKKEKLLSGEIHTSLIHSESDNV